MGLSREQSIQQYGTESYTGWDAAGAAADWKAKQGGSSGGGGLSTQQSIQQYGTEAYTGWGATEAQADFSAKNLQAPVNVPLSSGALNAEVERARTALESELARQQSQNEKRMEQARVKEQETLNKIEPLVQPFREDLEMAERERLHVNKNFEENQKLVDELDQLLTEGNELIRQQQNVTGLAAVRNPRIQQTMNDVAARAGVIEAVMNARNGQIAQAYNLIDRRVGAITQDRMDQIAYYETILSLTNRDIINLDADSMRIADQQLGLLKGDLNRAQATVDYIKQLMVNPDTAQLMGEAGVTLNDSIDAINGKLQEVQYRREIKEQTNQITLKGGEAVLDPSSVPAHRLVSFTDSRGQTYHYKMPDTTKAGSGNGADDYVNLRLTGRSSGSGSRSTAASQPQFSPAGGVGSIWVDPSTGRTWQYTSSGWRQIG